MEIPFRGRCCAFFSLLSGCWLSLASAYLYATNAPPPIADHGELVAEHNQDTQQFIDKNFKDQGHYSAEKISQFLNKLKQERENTKHDLYETKLFEKIKIDVKKFETAQRKAQEEADPAHSEILRGYDDYLIPHIERLLQLVKANQHPEQWDPLVQEFIRGYLTYYMPNAYRSFWPKDMEITTFVKRLFKPFRFKKRNYSPPEAFNLRVPPLHLNAARECLKRPVSSEEYLSQADLQHLDQCNFDLSQLDPGKSSFWQETSQKTRESLFTVDEGLFPREDEKVFFQRVIYRSRNSPKIKAYFIRDGKKIEFKIKLGQEVQSDNVAGKILTLLGFNQDVISYRPHVRIYLEEESFEQVFGDLANKYGRATTQTVISAHGKEGNLEWIDVEDVLLEGRPDNELRIAPIDLWSWDLTNRREYRGVLLLFGWLGLADMQSVNLKQLWQTTDQGLEPIYRIHDPGSSLGGALRLKTPNSIFAFIKSYRVNAFPKSFLSLDKRSNSLEVFWNDFPLRQRNFITTTYTDLKWMARKIASLDEAILREIFQEAGMPEPVAMLYFYKLMNRRNDMIRYFDLSNEFPIADVPVFKSLTLKHEGQTVIKNGKLVQTSFPGKNTVNQVPDNWWTALPQLMNFKVPVYDWNLPNSNHNNLVGLRNGLGIDNEFRFEDFAATNPVTSFPIGAGIQAILSRKVTPNHGPINSQGQIHLYRVSDRVRIRIGADSPLFRKILLNAPLIGGGVGINFFEKEFEFIHFKDTVKDAYLSAFKLPKILGDINKYVAFQLKPLEVIRVFNKYGFDVAAAGGLHVAGPAVFSGLGLATGVNKIVNRYFSRDMFGQVHYFIDKGKNAYGGFNLDIGAVELFPSSLSLLSIGAYGARFSNHQKDWVFKLPEPDRNNEEAWHNDIRQFEEYKALNTLTKDAANDDLPDFVDVGFEVKAKGKNKSRNFSLFYLSNHFKSQEQAATEVRLPDGRVKHFFHLATVTNRFIGLDNFVGDFTTFDLCVKNRRRTRIDVEVEDEELEKFTVNIKTEDYFTSRSAEGVERLITDLNYRYSLAKDQPFYHGYVLPPAEEINKYPKVYGLTYVILYGHDLLDRLRQMSVQELRAAAHAHFSGSWYPEEGDTLARSGALREMQIKTKVEKVISRITKMWQLLEQTPSPELTHKLAKHITKLISALETDVYGLYFFRDILANHSMYVMGEIAGLLRSYSNLQDLQQNERRRFMAHSWGEFKSLPPIQKFLRRDRLIPPSLSIRKFYADSRLFGILELGVAPNLEAFYTREEDF